MSCDVGRRRGSDPALLWLWPRPGATAQIRPLAWESPHAAEAAQRNSKKTKKKRKRKRKEKKKRKLGLLPPVKAQHSPRAALRRCNMKTWPGVSRYLRWSWRDWAYSSESYLTRATRLYLHWLSWHIHSAATYWAPQYVKQSSASLWGYISEQTEKFLPL